MAAGDDWLGERRGRVCTIQLRVILRAMILLLVVPSFSRSIRSPVCRVKGRVNELSNTLNPNIIGPRT